MKVCVAQIKPVKGAIDSNILNHVKWIERAIEKQADFIAFPELSLSGYEPILAHGLGMPQDDSRLDVFQHISDLKRITVGVGLPTRSEEGIRISNIYFQPNLPRQVYSKQYLHSDEKPYFIPGEGQSILKVGTMAIAPAICYESFCKNHIENALELGANLYAASVAKPYEGVEKALDYFSEMAAKYSVSVLMANSIGYCDNFESAGKSAIWNKHGDLVSQLDSESEGLLFYDIEEGI